VCVCVTLSVNSPTGQTPRRIFTVDSLKDADLRKYDFWGLDDELSHLGVQSPPKNPILGACISQIGEKFKQLYLQICVSDWHEFWQAGPATETVQMVLYMVVKQFKDGGQPPFWKSIYRHLMKNHPIWMKCCTQQQILNWMNVMWSKIKKLHWTDYEFDRTYILFIISHFGFGFTSAYNSILFCCLWRNVEPCCHTHDSRPLWLCIPRDALGRPIPAVNKKPAAKCEIQTTVQQLLIARPDNRWFADFCLHHLHSTPPLGEFPSKYRHAVWYRKTRMV